VWTGEKGDVATSRILWVYVKQTAAVTSGGYQEPEQFQEGSSGTETEESDAHSSLLTGRAALVYLSASPNEFGRGVEQKRELLVNEERLFLLQKPLPVLHAHLFSRHCEQESLLSSGGRRWAMQLLSSS